MTELFLSGYGGLEKKLHSDLVVLGPCVLPLFPRFNVFTSLKQSIVSLS
jgi:hypothetical protein